MRKYPCNITPQKLIGTAYDTVKDVSDNLVFINEIYSALVPAYKVDFTKEHDWVSDYNSTQTELGWIVEGTKVTSPIINIPSNKSLVWYLKAEPVFIIDWIGNVTVTYEDDTQETFENVIPLIEYGAVGTKIDLSTISGTNKIIRRIELIFAEAVNTQIQLKELSINVGFIPVGNLIQYDNKFDNLLNEFEITRVTADTALSRVDDVDLLIEDLTLQYNEFTGVVQNVLTTLDHRPYITVEAIDSTTNRLTGVTIQGETKPKLVSRTNTFTHVDGSGQAKYYWDATKGQFTHHGVVILPDGTVIESADDIVARNAEDAINVYLTRESFFVPTTAAGTNPVYAGSESRMVVVKGDVVLTENIVFSGASTKNGLQLSLNPVTGVFSLSGANWSTDVEWFDITATYNNTNYVKRFTVTKQRSPSSGIGFNNATFTLYQRTARGATPTPITGTVGFNFTTGAYTGLPSGGWSNLLPDNAFPLLWAIQKIVTTTNETISIEPNEWSTPRILSRDGLDGEDGADGGGSGVPGAGFYSGSYTSINWNTSGTDSATERFTQLVGRAPVFSDIFTQYNSIDGGSSSRQWNGSAWVSVANVIDGSLVVTNTIAGDKILAGTLLNAPILRGGRLELIGEPSTQFQSIISSSPFGPHNLVEWYGPKNSQTFDSINNMPIFSGMTKANAKTYKGADGSVYFGGTFIAGVISNAQASTTKTPTPSTQITFTSNGGILELAASFSFTGVIEGPRTNDNDDSWICPASPAMQVVTGTLFIEKQLSGGSWQVIIQQPITGSYSCNDGEWDREPGVPNAPYLAFSTSSAVVSTNTVLGAGTVVLRARAVLNNWFNLVGDMNTSTGSSQSISITSKE